ncbi:hypothetical protein [Halomonas sp. DN3]|uniref:ECs_2282 family putative zinc-binding protein n=1 Tax=Halomonas sp. DN3 TaxID=2953657 RepID=UPI00209E43FC|nr:hypothetical protein [Halomonas sp. DN3]USZ48103.1 hypothetical protein NKF27_11240 [Halomonas sp. DN3]
MTRVSAQCQNCGSDQFRIPDDEEQDQMIRCASCETEIGDKAEVMAELRKRATDEAEKQVGDMIERTFKGSKGFTFTRKK